MSGESMIWLNPVDGIGRAGEHFPKREGAQPVRGKGRAHPQIKPKERTFFQPDQGGLQAQQWKDVRMDAKQLPAGPSLEQYRKQAKDLLKARKSPEATHRLKRFHPRLAKLTEAEIAEAKLSLADAQWVIAREYGF